MEKQYYAIRRGDNNQNSLKHWKYIKREKVDGKWRYYYDTVSKVNKSINNAISKLEDKRDSVSDNPKYEYANNLSLREYENLSYKDKKKVDALYEEESNKKSVYDGIIKILGTVSIANENILAKAEAGGNWVKAKKIEKRPMPESLKELYKKQGGVQGYSRK